jgi:N-hydroxyarylamine O-acetyltransferase
MTGRTLTQGGASPQEDIFVLLRKSSYMRNIRKGEIRMDAGSFDLDAYLARVGFDRPLARNAACLADLHEAHLAAIPFENLDIGLGRPIGVDLASVQAKLVGDGRGGYCFEHATLFMAALERIGFACRLLAARVRWRAPPGAIRPRSHFFLEVDTPEGQVLADVGFGGDGPLRPLPLLPELVSHMPGSAHRLRHDSGCWVLECDMGEGWNDLYAFTMERQHPIDVEVANHYVSTYPGSIFRQTLLVQKIRRHRRAALRDRTLEIRAHGRTEQRRIETDAELLTVLADEFSLVFPPETRFRLPDAEG